MASQHNVVIFITDQERATQHFGGTTREADLAWEQANLPNLTWLKQNGVSFTNAYCNATMCTPSRCTLYTGLYPAQHQAKDTLTDNGSFSPSETSLDPTIFNIAHLFHSAGYQVQFRGKWHLCKNPVDGTTYVRTEDVAQYGFAGWVGPDSGQDQAITNMGGGFLNHDGAYMKQIKAFLGSQEVHEKPFLLICSLVNPHDVLAYPVQWEYGYTPDWFEGDVLLDYTQTHDEDLTQTHKPRAQAAAAQGAPFLLGPLVTPENKTNYLNFYANLIKLQDTYLGEVIDQLRKEGLLDETVIIRTADHGEMGMSHGGLRQKAFMAYEEAIRIPLVVSMPGQLGKGTETAQFAGLVDILPTLADWLGKSEIVEKLPGNSLLSVIQDPQNASPVQDSILFTFDDIRAGNPNKVAINTVANRLRTLRTARWKFSRYFHSESTAYPEYELYDLELDPIELYNLSSAQVVQQLIESGARPPEYADLVKQMLKEMAEKLHQTEQDKLWGYAPTHTTMKQRQLNQLNKNQTS